MQMKIITANKNENQPYHTNQEQLYAKYIYIAKKHTIW